MTIQAEIDFLFALDPSGVIVKEGNDAKLENLREWLSIPAGSVYGLPLWGHTLSQYRHAPHSTTTARAIENSILIKLASDLPDLPVSRILCNPVGKDAYYLMIATPYGIIEETEKAI